MKHVQRLIPASAFVLNLDSTSEASPPCPHKQECGKRGQKRMHACMLHGDEVVKCGGHLQWINTADRLGSLCLECAIGTHS